MQYIGQMKVQYLNDRQIRASQYKKWAHAARYFEQHPKDQKKVQELKESIPKVGLRVPVILGVCDRTMNLWLADGHHRAVALMQLGAETFPFRWYWLRSWSFVHIEHTPFPYHLLDQDKNNRR